MHYQFSMTYTSICSLYFFLYTVKLKAAVAVPFPETTHPRLIEN